MSTRLPSKTGSSHGGVRGADFDRRSSQSEGKFGRIFRSLPAATWSEDALRALAGDGKREDRMTAKPETAEPENPRLPEAPREDVDDEGNARGSRLHDDEENSRIDAGYTYLGQFIDHDITFDPASSLQQRNDVDALVDFRTPALDLDSVYGSGPDDQPYMYTANGRKFQLGRDLYEGKGGKVIAKDLPRHTWCDEDGTHHRALIGDKRNDENVIIAQLHAVFLQFHNRLADEHCNWDFPEIQRQVRWHYQYVVLNDFLRQITSAEVYKYVLPHLSNGSNDGSIFDNPPRLQFYRPRNDAFMPIEFAAAAYRFGHSMVRPIYRLNTKLTGGNTPDETTPDEKDRGIDGRQFIFAGLKGRGLNGFDEFPQEWGIDWNLFFDLTSDKECRKTKDRTQPAYKIDSSLVNPLAFLPEFSQINKQAPLDDVSKLQPDPLPKQFNNLALRNLLRGMSMGLPSGQDVARAMGYEPLKDSELKVGKATTVEEYDKLPILPCIDTGFTGKAPLWYYILAEAAHDWRYRQDGGKAETPTSLGKVGSRIVIETLVGLLLHDSHSFLRQAPAWKPEIGKKEKFDMPDFIKYALEI
jgi:Animal haem peroxidase